MEKRTLWTPEAFKSYVLLNQLAASIPFKENTCTVYNSPELRFSEEGCGIECRLLGRDPYPVGVDITANNLGIPPQKIRWEIVRCTKRDKWIAGFLFNCGYYITDADVKNLQRQNLVRVFQDTNSAHIYLLDYNFDIPPIIHRWRGHCLRCGWCCRVPRSNSGRSCIYLHPKEPILRNTQHIKKPIRNSQHIKKPIRNSQHIHVAKS